MSDLNFERWLSEFNQSYAEAEAYSDWMPEDGKYSVLVTKVEPGEYEKNGRKNRRWKFTAEIVAGDSKVMGQKFSWTLFSAAPGMIKGQAAALNGGQELPTGQDAIATIESAAGKVLDVTIRTSADKNGKDRTNCYIDGIVDVQKQDANEPEHPQGNTAEVLA
jgi:hypothetical protein